MKSIALVTGGTSGIGAAVSRKLFSDGYLVIANYHTDHEKAQEFQIATGIITKSWDVGDYQACQRAIEEITLDTKLEISVLINNAGITIDKMFHKMLPEHWTKVINTNLLSCFNMSHVVINYMRERKNGRIINISSVNALTGQVGQTNYSAAKSGIFGFTKSLAREVATKNITVNSIAPGYIKTDMTDKIEPIILDQIKSLIPVKKLGDVSDVANIVSFLASKESAYITGVNINVNGGLFM